MITIEDFLRYSRQMMLPEVGESGQEKLKSARVLVIGAGGLGCPVLQYLATAGIGTLGIVDFDVVEIHNLHRQVLYSKNELGAGKAETAKRVLQILNPNIEIIALDEKITAENAKKILADFDLVIDGSDNFSTRYLVNDTCVALGKALVYGSILKFQGQLAVFNHKGSKNLRDLFPEPPNPHDVPSCSINGVLGTLPGIIGSMMAQEALKLILGVAVLENELVVFDTMEWNFRKLRF